MPVLRDPEKLSSAYLLSLVRRVWRLFFSSVITKKEQQIGIEAFIDEKVPPYFWHVCLPPPVMEEKHWGQLVLEFLQAWWHSYHPTYNVKLQILL